MQCEKSTRKFDVGSKASTQGHEEVRERPDLNWNKGRGA